MLREIYKQYIKVSRGISDKSVGHYVTGLNTVNAILSKNGFPISDVFDITDIEELNAVRAFLQSNEEFLRKDAVGHNMYSVAFKHFYRFACEDELFFAENLRQMDIPVSPPAASSTVRSGWRRNQIIAGQAIEGTNFTCENAPDHRTFIAKATGKPYMEGHHLIPMKFQSEFDTGIDVYANVVCLCPICHRLLHYGTDREKAYAAEKLFDARDERLQKCGIDISKRDFLKLVI